MSLMRRLRSFNESKGGKGRFPDQNSRESERSHFRECDSRSRRAPNSDFTMNSPSPADGGSRAGMDKPSLCPGLELLCSVQHTLLPKMCLASDFGVPATLYPEPLNPRP